MKKKNSLFLSIVLAVNIVFSGVITANAKVGTIINLQIDNPVMTVNKDYIEIDPGEGTTPVIRNDRTLVPIRAIIEALDGTVGWDGNTQTASLKVDDDTVKLTIGSLTAYHNGVAKKLDVSPTIINNRTMLPIRFIAESFELSVGWNGDTRTVTVSDIPTYSGKAYAQLNDNEPDFESSEISYTSFEYYSELDRLGRCGETIASVGRDIMPTSERGNISSVKPTGWHSVQYEGVGYLYNRCHLIGFQLTGENANKKNLITGTRYMNVNGMLPFENEVAQYVKSTGNHVMYRVTPIFVGNNLLSDGVVIEAYSVEDNGKGVSFCVYCYNVQPGIGINYLTGASWGGTAVNNTASQQTSSQSYVLNTNSKKFHYPSCASAKKIKDSNKAVSSESRSALISKGYLPCGNCNP